jgi:glucokinase
MSRSGAVAGIDAGGTKVSGLILAGGEVAGTCRLDTDDSSEGAFVATIERCFCELKELAAARGLELEALGLGVAGYVDFARGVVTESPNLPLRDLHLRDLLADRLALPVFMDNDANAAALAENRLGAGKGCRHQVHLTLGTGIGGGLIIDGRVYRGASGTAAELGHIVILEGGPLTNCGHRGCLEALASGTAVEREARERYAGGWRPGAGETSTLEALEALEDLGNMEDMEALGARHVTLAAKRGDAVALDIWEEMGRHLGVGIACYLNIFNPEMVTLSGGLLSAWEFFQAAMFRAIEENAIPLSLGAVRIMRTTLEGEAGALGAALLAMES